MRHCQTVRESDSLVNIQQLQIIAWDHQFCFLIWIIWLWNIYKMYMYYLFKARMSLPRFYLWGVESVAHQSHTFVACEVGGIWTCCNGQQQEVEQWIHQIKTQANLSSVDNITCIHDIIARQNHRAPNSIHWSGSEAASYHISYRTSVSRLCSVTEKFWLAKPS